MSQKGSEFPSAFIKVHMRSHSCTHRCTLALVGRTLLHTSGILQCLAPRLSEPWALRRHPVSEGDSPGVQKSLGPFQASGSGVVTTAGASPGFVRRIIFSLSLIPLPCPGRGLQTIFPGLS